MLHAWRELSRASARSCLRRRELLHPVAFGGQLADLFVPDVFRIFGQFSWCS